MDAKPTIQIVDGRIVSITVTLEGDDGPELLLTVTQPPATREDPAAHRRRQIQLSLRDGRHDRRRKRPDRETLGYVEIDCRDHYIEAS